MLRFHRPSSSRGGSRGVNNRSVIPKQEETTLFPPTIYTDETYTNGMLVPTPTSSNVDANGIEEVVVQLPSNYFQTRRRVHGNTAPTLPSLSKNDSSRWNDAYAAQACCRRRSPMNAVRLLGTITLLFEEKGGKKASKGSSSLFDQSKKYSDKACNRMARRQPAKKMCNPPTQFSKKKALGEAISELGYDEDVDIESLSKELQIELEQKAEEIYNYWKVVKSTKPLDECWDVKDGGFRRDAVGGEASIDGEFYVPILCLLNWMKGGDQIVDLYEGRVKSLYNGLCHIPTDALTVLRSLVDLSCPNSLYKIPLITPYAVASRVVKGSKTTWKVRIGVYMNRLLPEVLTAKTLHCVMSALDDNSYIASEPLHMPPTRNNNDPVFQSSKYPIVKLPTRDFMDIDDKDDLLMEEEKKEDDDDVQEDIALGGSTRESKTVSAFSTKGYLRLLENTGNDISQYSEIAKSLSQYLKLDLMLHQRHALCWMTQMEHLEGFGINSILWEERRFLDGGSYYYSPALGQIRLNKPPVTVGGCLADEMGLGKTIETLALIASSLDELKTEAKDGGQGCTHATLIIVPPALVAQWVKEIQKTCGDKLVVDVLDANTTEKVISSQVNSSGTGCDILITTYSALDRPKPSQYLASWSWGRIVLDEQQEIRSSTTKIAKNCESLVCHRRWMLSGTPLFEGVQDLRGELNFLRLSPYAAKWEDGFFDFSIMNHWNVQSSHGLETLRILGLLILRRSKDMTICQTGASIMNQKRLTVDFVSVEQTDSERALYCWLESVVSQEVSRKDSTESKENKQSLQSKSLCLRLLREVCFSPVMINGGLGVQSQMKVLNGLYRKILAREEKLHQLTDGHRNKRTETTRTMSPLEALRFLSQADKAVNVQEGFVSDQRVGRGQGVSNRTRATEDIGQLVADAQTLVNESTKKRVSSKQTIARKRWQLALELVTTGVLCDEDSLSRVKPSIRNLWKWRSIFIGLEAQLDNPCLLRGWRPQPSFAKQLLISNPTFRWASPGCLQLDNIPAEVSLEEITTGVFEGSKKEPRVRAKIASLQKSKEKAKGSSKKQDIQTKITEAEGLLQEAIAYDNNQLQRPQVVKVSSTSLENWQAYVLLADDGEEFLRNAKSKVGISIPSATAVPHIEAEKKKAKERFDQCEAEYNVHPSTKHKNDKAEAKKLLEVANLGLTMSFDTSAVASTTSNVVVSQAMVGGLRGIAPPSKAGMINGCNNSIEQATESLERAMSKLREGESTLSRLLPIMARGVEDVGQKSAYEVLEALRKQKFSETQCSICLGPFGDNADEDPTQVAKIVSMIVCGHFFCNGCLDTHIHSAISNMRRIKCPNCRQGFGLSDVIHIDHLASDDEEELKQRTQAKAKVIEASKVLATSDGILDADMWQSLFLSIDVPTNVDNSPHHLHTALRRDVLAHFRAACGMRIDSPRSSAPSSDQPITTGLSSKIQTLLHDLPFGEHAVVFCASKEMVLHLAVVIKAKGIECFSLFTGQKTAETSKCVSTWETTEANTSMVGPVLVIQAGAAASGLTLTKASKVFLMEPFQRQEEEQQAFARCHRYGQEKDVSVKIYYSPVTVESRLLAWRRRSAEKLVAESGTSSSNYIFSQLDKDDEDSETSDTEDLTESSSEEEEDEREDEEVQDEESKNGSEEETTEEDTLRTQFLLGLVNEDGNALV